MRIHALKFFTLVFLLMPGSLFAKPTRFVNGGLKDLTIVTLDVTGKKATGTMVIHDRMDEPGPTTSFTGEVIPTPKGKKGVYLEVHFDGQPPYNIPPGAKRLIWYLKIIDRRAHLFIPTYQRNYQTKPYSWVVADNELEPESEDEPSR
jgi:hypothetical protein